MADIEWREIKWKNAHEHIGKPVRGIAGRHAIIGLLSYATPDSFGIHDESFLWSSCELTYAWYPASSNITLTDPGQIKRFVEDMDEKGSGKYVR